jgi:hypothetical protein
MEGERHPSLPYPNGLTFCDSDPKAVATPSGTILAALAGRPRGEGFRDKTERLDGFMGYLMDTVQFSEKERGHRRGNYPAIHTGISYGGGSKVALFVPTPPDETWHADIPERNAGTGGIEGKEQGEGENCEQTKVVRRTQHSLVLRLK